MLVRDVVLTHDVTRERQVDRLKADFIATVSHELRTPVTPIKGYADLLRKRGESMTPEKRAECLDVIADRSAHLARLVEDLLLASRMTSAQTPTHAVRMQVSDLRGLVERAVGDFPAERTRIQLRMPAEPLLVRCDPVRVVQVTSNLVSNAVKYSPPGSPVDIKVVCRRNPAADPDTPLRAEVVVTDSGRGIPADQREKVFDKFHRVEDALRMTTSGTGLGLYIARHLAQAMGGDLTLRSTLGVGSVFTFGVPLASGEEEPEEPAPGGPGQGTWPPFSRPPFPVPPRPPAGVSGAGSGGVGTAG